MRLTHNPSFLRQAGIMIVVLAAIVAAAYVLDGARCALWAAGAGLATGALFALFSALRSRQVMRLASEVDEVLHEGRRIDFSDYREGDLAILKNQLSKMVATLRDATMRLEKEKGALADALADVSHQIRTPLTAMRALIEPLRDGLVKTEEQRQQIYDVVLRETMRLSRLVNDMLELSRLQSGTASLSRSVFAPLPLLDLIHETYSAYAEDYQQTFVYDVPKDLPNVVGNPDRTQQVLIALLDNAFKYTPEGGTVTLSACTEDQVVRIRVTDTGVGIPAADLPHVFDRFYKVDKSHHSKGTGLGLAIAYEIMKHLGEEMSVTSEPGKGSCFTFTLHMADEKETPAQ